MERNKIYNEDCFITMDKMPIGAISTILTSPFYNTNKKQGSSRTLTDGAQNGYPYLRYDTHVDNMTDEEYCQFTENLFLEFDRILNLNGVVLYNLSYGNNNRDGMFKAISTIIEKTPFCIGDVIIWKKKSAMPNNCSKNKLTRITEFIFVLVRKDEIGTFNCNKKIVSQRATGQNSYENVFNFIEAKNNDAPCPYNKATFSSELVEKLLNFYGIKGTIVYDPFMGSGTTAIGSMKYGCDFIGSEISQKQCKFAINRINTYNHTT